MPVLSSGRQERFAQELARGKSQIEAYTIAGYVPDKANADKLADGPRVRARVEELLEEGARLACLDRAWILKRLMENAERAMQASPVLDREGNPTGEFKYDGTVANRSLELLGKEVGMFVDRAENVTVVHTVSREPLTVEQWEAEFAAPAGPTAH